ncbi:alpha/beta fold hydrolase [Streptomyces blattellae]|uniref:alpha/beta fold hydrolase n=1 Tax=Streptomyces blattellae TaxID=2569855 RepID=UPI0012B9CD44|nr:alpha/beta hydrolase [Streptomyces blattellae]
MPELDEKVTSSFVDVGGLRTHVLEAGDGPAVVLLHSGEYGGSAETSWGLLMPALADAGYRAIAPDWLGFGLSDKVVDFGDPTGRRLRTMAATLAELGVERPALVGTSMGATVAARDLASDKPAFDAAALVMTSGGGFAPDNEARRSIIDYDMSVEGMRRILDTIMYRKHLVKDDEYVAWRHQLSLMPGAWECTASARLRPARVSETTEQPIFGKPDPTEYERIRIPTLIVAGAEDGLRLPGFADELVARFADGELRLYEDCGHLPNLEWPERYADDVIDFLDRRYRPTA